MKAHAHERKRAQVALVVSALMKQGATGIENTLVNKMAKLTDPGAGTDMNPVLASCAMNTDSPMVAMLLEAKFPCYHICTVDAPSVLSLLDKYPTFNYIQDGVVGLAESDQEADASLLPTTKYS